MIHGSSCEANLPLIAALPKPIAVDLELTCYEKMYYTASSPKSGCVLSTINHYLRRLIQKTVARSSGQVKMFKCTDRVVCPAFPSLSALQQTHPYRHSTPFILNAFAKQLRKATVSFPLVCLSLCLPPWYKSPLAE